MNILRGRRPPDKSVTVYDKKKCLFVLMLYVPVNKYLFGNLYYL